MHATEIQRYQAVQAGPGARGGYRQLDEVRQCQLLKKCVARSTTMASAGRTIKRSRNNNINNNINYHFNSSRNIYGELHEVLINGLGIRENNPYVRGINKNDYSARNLNIALNTVARSLNSQGRIRPGGIPLLQALLRDLRFREGERVNYVRHEVLRRIDPIQWLEGFGTSLAYVYQKSRRPLINRIASAGRQRMAEHREVRNIRRNAENGATKARNVLTRMLQQGKAATKKASSTRR